MVTVDSALFEGDNHVVKWGLRLPLQAKLNQLTLLE